MNHVKTFMLIVLSSFFLGLSVNGVEAEEKIHEGLIKYFEIQYGAPFQMVGKVVESSGDRVLFSINKREKLLEKGQQLWVCEHRKGVSPPLQRKVAWLQVEAVFFSTVLARVIDVVGRPIAVEDLVLTPPSPLIHVYTNVESKHTFTPYQTLLKYLLAANIELKEIEGDFQTRMRDKADLLLRLEGEAGHLICRLTTLSEGRLLYSKSLVFPEKMDFAFPPGRALKTEAPSPVVTATAPPRFMPRQNLPPSSTPVRSTFTTAKPMDQSDFYRLSGSYHRVVACDLEGDALQDLVFLGEKGVVAYQIDNGHMVETSRYNFTEEDIYPIHLHSLDMDGDGGDEIMVTLARPTVELDKQDNRLTSQVLTLVNGRFQPIIKDWPYYLRVISGRRGEGVALAQAEGDFNQFSGAVYQIHRGQNDGSIVLGEPYAPAKGVYSIYQFNLVPENPKRIIILEPINILHGYFTPEERIEASGERNYGEYAELAYPLKLEEEVYLGGLSEKKTHQDVYSPRRFELRPGFDGQSFLIYKERQTGFADTVMDKVLKTSQHMDQVVGVKFVGNRIIETWQSKKLAKDILDFAFMENPDRILILYRDEDGCGLEALY